MIFLPFRLPLRLIGIVLLIAAMTLALPALFVADEISDHAAEKVLGSFGSFMEWLSGTFFDVLRPTGRRKGMLR